MRVNTAGKKRCETGPQPLSTLLLAYLLSQRLAAGAKCGGIQPAFLLPRLAARSLNSVLLLQRSRDPWRTYAYAKSVRY